MMIPEGYTEQEVLDIMERISGKLANKFKFGYHEIDDMKQQASMYAWEGIEKYDGVRPLENFLWVHVRNRLFNYKRNNYARPDKPCNDCPLNAYIDHRCTAYDNIMNCEHYSKWENRNQAKRNLMSTKEHVDYIDPISERPEDFSSKEIYDIIDKNMPVEMRESWIRFSKRLKLPKAKRDAILEVIQEIFKEHGIESQTW